jgi:hypothetical protein
MLLADRATLTGGFLKVVELQASDAYMHPEAFDCIRGSDLQAIIVHNVYAADQLRTVVERLEKHEPPFLQTWFPGKFRAWFFGQNLNLADGDLESYFAEVGVFHNQLEDLFSAAQGFVDRISGILSSLDGGRPFCAAPGPRDGERYMFTTLRAHVEGGYIPAHFDNEQALRPSFSHLRQIVEPHMMSFVLTLESAEAGGDLEVFNYRCDPSRAVLISDDRAATKPCVGNLESVKLRVPPGSMIILDSGRYLHRVLPVQGSRKRWTACSFMSMTMQKNAMYCWG